MLDKLVLHIPFKLEHIVWLGSGDNEIGHIPIESLPCDIETTGNIIRHPDGSKSFEELKTKFESLPSSHSGMAFKIFENGLNCDPFVMIQCSPAKLLQGHNLFGFDDMAKSGVNMLALLSDVYSELYEMLDIKGTQVSEFDINYSAFVKNPETKKLLLDHLRYTSKGQTKNRGDNYATTIYFGKKVSRLKKLKVYSKFEEMLEDVKKMMKKGYKESAAIIKDLSGTDRAKEAVRFEATIKKRFLERRGIPLNFFKLSEYLVKNEWAYKALFEEAWKDIFDALKGQEIKAMNDEMIYQAIYDSYHTIDSRSGNVRTTKVNRLYSFYQTMKSLGFEHLKTITSNSAFHRNLADLRNCGLSQSTLQNLKKDDGAVIHRIARLIEINFDNQVPDDYQLPPDLYEAHG